VGVDGRGSRKGKKSGAQEEFSFLRKRGPGGRPRDPFRVCWLLKGVPRPSGNVIGKENGEEAKKTVGTRIKGRKSAVLGLGKNIPGPEGAWVSGQRIRWKAS